MPATKSSKTLATLVCTLLLWSQCDASPRLRGLATTNTNDDNSVETRIIGGTAVNVNEDRYPYYGLMMGRQSLCGSVLITPSIALSAAHCQYTSDRIFVGQQSRAAGYQGYENIAIRNKIVHPEWIDNGSYVNDIIIHHLDVPSTKQYIRLNSNDNVPANSQSLTVMGFGDTNPGAGFTIPTTLNVVDVDYLQQNLCKAAHGQNAITDGMMCAADTNRDACGGDSGGPLVIKGATEAEDSLVGLVSWGRGCADEAYPGVYTRISEYYDWVVEQVCLLSPDDAPDYMGCTPSTPTTPTNPPTVPSTAAPTTPATTTTTTTATSTTTLVETEAVWKGWTPSSLPLNECEGDCDSDADCAGDLVCRGRFFNGSATGCSSTNLDFLPKQLGDFCVQP